MKINKIITLSLALVLAPALSAQSMTADVAKGYARSAAFHASRFVAGRLAMKALVGIQANKSIKDYGDKRSDTVRTVLHAMQIGLPILGTSALAALAPQAFNKAAANSNFAALRFLAPQSGQSEVAGQLAFWLGQAFFFKG